MAKLNLDYYHNEDLYTDGDIEEEMLRLADDENVANSLEPSATDFAVLYHFSPIRENILNWYPFKEGAHVLEIGAGCGAITGALCQRAEKVVSVELSKRRATINYKRHKNCDNLEIMVGNFNDMQLGQTFDYVVLNGVFEYAISFTEGSTPYETFLKKIISFLKEDGRILIAIENRLGLKYFAGAVEDHTDLYFLGLNKYPGYDKVRTFSKQELITIFEACDLEYYKFYYPYPDYKFPKEIFTDASIYLQNYGKPSVNLSNNKVHLLDESVVAESFIKEEVMDVFANSFLVEVGKKEIETTENIEYVKLNMDRKPQFRIATVISESRGERVVAKKALTQEAETHMEQLLENQGKVVAEGYINLPGEKGQNSEVIYPYLTLDNVDNEICELIERKDTKGIVQRIEKVFETYFECAYKTDDIYSERFTEVFGKEKRNKFYHCLNSTNIDMIFDNIFADGDKYYVIDCEWIFDFPIPLEFVVWRAINELYSKHKKLYELIEKNELMHLYNIDKKDERLFFAWSYHFAYVYVGSDSLNGFAKKEKQIPLEEIVRDVNRKENPMASLYYDTGKGFNEEEKLEACIEMHEDMFCVEYDISNITGVKNVRWDPTEYDFCVCSVEYDTTLLEYTYSNALTKTEEGELFATKDPNYNFGLLKEDVSKIRLVGNIRLLDADELAKEMNDAYQQKCRELEDQKEKELERVREKETLENELAVANRRTEEMTNSLSWRMTKPVRKTKKVLKGIKNVLTQKERVEKQITEPVIKTLKDCIRYNIDKAECEEGILQVHGWVFCENRRIQTVRMEFVCEQETVIGDTVYLQRREDVKEILGVDFKGNCGLYVVAKYSSDVDRRLCLRIRVDNEEMLIITDVTVPATDADDSEFYCINKLGSDIEYREFCENFVAQKENRYTEEYLNTCIDIIIPVYNGYEFLENLFDTVSHTKMKYRLLLVEDCSTDPRVRPFLEKYAATDEHVKLLLNDVNMGFVKSVNKALAISEGHVVLLNTDVEVPERWLERLMYPIITEEKVATSTPFTNCGTIFSFPNTGMDNELIAGLNVNEVDNYFAKIIPSYISVPTGVGFCMGMNKDAIKEIGLLDDVNFGKGYGEENDWCQRSIKAGYHNVYVENLFVYHNHGGSFPSEEKQALLEVNGKKLLEKHPNYMADVAKFCEIDPNRNVREYVCFEILSKLSGINTTIAFDHNLGGGASAYLERYKLEHVTNGERFAVVKYDVIQMAYLLECVYKEWHITMKFHNAEDLKKHLEGWEIDSILVNELVSYPDLYDWLEYIVGLCKNKACKLCMLLHDYYAICPTINLMNHEFVYCGIPDCTMCDTCAANNAEVFYKDYETMDKWRKKWGDFLLTCDEVRVFSKDSKTLITRAYPQLANINYVPHQTDVMFEIRKAQKTTNTINVGILGVISEKKGLSVLKELVRQSHLANDNIHYVVIGQIEDEWEDDKLTVTGRYRREELPNLVFKYDIDLFLLSSICPETFSYTTDEVMKMKMPLVVFNLGAPAERVALYEKGLVIDYPQSIEGIYANLLAFSEEYTKDYARNLKNKILFIAEENSYASRYRVEHLQEQLLLKGVNSDFVMLNHINESCIGEYNAVVLYRCKQFAEVFRVVEKARQERIPVYYDIDDYVFEYDHIKYLDFLSEKEYENFENECDAIKQCMKLADVYIVSTEQLKKAVLKSFPHAEVHVNRNKASIEMHLLSEKAIANKTPKDSKFVISYFSGSRTHDKDFELITPVLLSVLERYPHTELLLGGCINVPSVFSKYKKRVRTFEFVDWQKLPSYIAESDVTLMPLEDTFFHSCKSENKWTEAALVKVPVVASYNEEIAKVIIDQQDGFLCKNGEEWEAIISKMIEEPQIAKEVAEAAYNKVTKEYLTLVVEEDILDLFS